MSIEASIATRLDELVAEASVLSQYDEDYYDERRWDADERRWDAQAQKCRGWLAAAVNIVQVVLPNSEAGYRKSVEKIAEADYGHAIDNAVGEVAAILVNLIKDSRSGLLSSVADHARAEVFDDFLDHAKSYMKDGHKNEAGVIAGVVFEDTVRRVCCKHGISESGKKLDALISQLAKSDVLSTTKAKRARVAADVRNKATHAQWNKFDDNDLKTTIEFTEEMILEHVDK